MSAKQNLALAVLGAGEGKRFQSQDQLWEDKLNALLAGRPVSHYLLKTVCHFSFAQKILICRPNAPWAEAYEKAGFTCLWQETPQKGMLNSLHKAVHETSPTCSHLLICLADMPFISKSHLSALIGAFETDKNAFPAFATHGGTYKGPPAILTLRDLKTLPETGEGGARSLLGKARLVPCPAEEIRDIDTQQDLCLSA